MQDIDPGNLDGQSPCHYEVRFSRDAERQLGGLDARDRGIILDAIEDQLTHQPRVPTRHRKLLRENPLADWELRVGEYRVFYDIDDDPSIVMILTIGVKSHNTLPIEGQEIQL
jgi:mRNA-degrading endonuclease RelE of RelBE toxin-antitoxin system